MRTYRAFKIAAAVTVLGLVLTMALHGGWEAVAAAATIFAGMASLALLMVLEAMGERPRS